MIKKVLAAVKAKLDPEKPDWIVCAEKELGEKEVHGGENPRILEYFKATTLHATEDEVSWCSAFVNWVMMTCGYERSHLAAARSWLGTGTPLKGFKKYAIVIFKRGGSPWQGHVAFALEDNGDTITCLGGNQSDMVCIKRFKKANVIGYRWPVKQVETKVG